MVGPLDVPAPQHGDVERGCEFESIEAVQRCRGRPARPCAGPTVEQERGEFVQWGRRYPGGAEDADTGLLEDTALDSASKFGRRDTRITKL